MVTEAPAPSPVAVESTQQLFELAYRELHRIAHQQRQRIGALATLSTTALVHEVYLKLSPQSQGLERAHFLALTARAMRQVLIDHSRSRVCLKRGGEFLFTEVNENHQDDAAGDMADMLALDQSLIELTELDARAAQVVEWHVFGGMRLEEIAELQGIAVRTAYRDWRRARAFLVQRLGLTNRVAQQ
ncbi:MAG: sigma-70 family polymerase sigma factor [Gammaproteobacteria bacterium]|jgi:RNA polymerase sigma factor (TIGR02999 family)|nr:sigma-70 family polymerase sigma factor [Gammaproteobacteria bacterium]